MVDHPVPHGLLHGHRFFTDNPGFDLSYEGRWLKLDKHYVAWAPEKGMTPSTILMFQEQHAIIIPARTTQIVSIQVFDASNVPLRNQFGFVSNCDSTQMITNCDHFSHKNLIFFHTG